MKIRIILFALLLMLTPTLTVYASETNSETIVTDTDTAESDPMISPFASYIIVSSTWTLTSSSCVFSLTFLTTTTGSGTFTLQRQYDSFSWINVGSVNGHFTDAQSSNGQITVSSLPAGTYRIKMEISANDITETIYTVTRKLY